MPANAELLVDTSVAVALAVADHEHHEATVEAVGGAGWVSPDTPRSRRSRC
jgi:predicted nucleic acid-binding protein